MSQWGNTDVASNSVLWAPTGVKQAPTRTNANLMFGNTTANGYGTGETIGMYGVDAAEMVVNGGPVVAGFVTFAGSGYGANAAITVTAVNGGTSAAANATANTSTGRIIAINISTAGSGYKSPPTAVVAAPAALNVTANTTGVSNTTDTIALSTANSLFAVGDRIYYTVPTGNTAIGGMTGNTFYYISFVNASAFAVSTTQTGSNVNLTEATATAGQTHTITGETATAQVTVGGGLNTGLAHAGWVVRTEGSGGRAGRVNYETLVAMGSIASDASDDTILPDS